MASWKESLEAVAIGLLSLEVNTIRKSGMSAQKMPDVPIALHSVLGCYDDYLAARGYGVDQTLLGLAHTRISAPPPPNPDILKQLMDWRPSNTAVASVDMTNGATSFEALRWAATAALYVDIAKKGEGKDLPFPPEERAVLTRIQSNCRQLTPVILDLQRLYPVPAKPGPETPVYIGGTLEQTAQACFAGSVTSQGLLGGKTKFKSTLNVVVLVRKMWDIGTETVLAQTSVQVDGDVVTRISPLMEESQRDFLITLHESSLKIGLGQWQALFSLVTSLISTLGKDLFKSF